MKNQKKSILIAAVLLTTVIAVATTTAYMFHKSEKKTNEFIPASVSCEVKEVFDGTKKTSITVTNTGNIPGYIRLNFSIHWIDEEQNIVGEPAKMPKIDFNDDWIRQGDIFYYKYPVQKNDATEEFLKNPIILEEQIKDGKKYCQVVEVFAEIIQSDPKAAVNESWNLSVGESGELLAP